MTNEQAIADAAANLKEAKRMLEKVNKQVEQRQHEYDQACAGAAAKQTFEHVKEAAQSLLTVINAKNTYLICKNQDIELVCNHVLTTPTRDEILEEARAACKDAFKKWNDAHKAFFFPFLDQAIYQLKKEGK